MLLIYFVLRFSDCIVLLDNDDVLTLLSKRADKSSNDKPAVTYRMINSYMAATLANVFWPIDSLAFKRLLTIRIS